MPNRNHKEKFFFNLISPLNLYHFNEDNQKKVNERFQQLLANHNDMVDTLKDFRPSKWNNMSEEQKLKTCQNLENCLAVESGRAPFRIIVRDDSPYRGKTFPGQMIQIRMAGQSSFDILWTLAHEACHADQFVLISKNDSAQKETEENEKQRKERKFQIALEKSGLNQNDFLVMKWELLSYVHGHNETPDKVKSKLYKMQLIETEAEFESFKFLKKYGEYMGDEGDFTGYLERNERKLMRLHDNFKDESLEQLWFADRRHRFRETTLDYFREHEANHINAIYLSDNFGDCGFALLSDLETWRNSVRKETIEKVTLDELMDKKSGGEGPSRRRPSDPESPKQKKARIGLG